MKSGCSLGKERLVSSKVGARGLDVFGWQVSLHGSLA